MKLRVLEKNPREEYGTTRQIGLGGCAVVNERGLAPGSLVELVLPLEGGMVTADGRVAYRLEIEADEPRFEIGIEFLRVEPRHLDRIRRLVEGR